MYINRTLNLLVYTSYIRNTHILSRYCYFDILMGQNITWNVVCENSFKQKNNSTSGCRYSTLQKNVSTLISQNQFNFAMP